MNFLFNDKLKLENIETVVWDKDGTIIDDNYFWGEIVKRRAAEIINEYNADKSFFDEICTIIGYDTKSGKLISMGPVATLSREEVLDILHEDLIKLGIPSDKKKNDDIFTRVHEKFKNVAMDYTILLPHAEDAIIKFAEKNVKQILITSDTRENAQLCLAKYNLDKFFCAIYGKNDFNLPKKTGEPLCEAIKRNNLQKETTVCIGDAKMDYEMGFNAGIKAQILIATGHTPLNELLKLSKYSVQNLSYINFN